MQFRTGTDDSAPRAALRMLVETFCGGPRERVLELFVLASKAEELLLNFCNEFHEQTFLS